MYIEEPKPGASHVICAICREKFTDYYQHIFSKRHQRGIEDNRSTFDMIDETIISIKTYQTEKEKRLK